jgi:hypothetical protein
MKSSQRFSKASGSTRRRVEQVLRRGWKPGAGRVSDYYKSTRRSRRNRTEAGNHGS